MPRSSFGDKGFAQASVKHHSAPPNLQKPHPKRYIQQSNSSSSLPTPILDKSNHHGPQELDSTEFFAAAERINQPARRKKILLAIKESQLPPPRKVLLAKSQMPMFDARGRNIRPRGAGCCPVRIISNSSAARQLQRLGPHGVIEV